MALTFFWRCEGETLDGTHDYSAGDTTATNNTGNCTIDTTTYKVGASSAFFNAASENYQFAPSSIISSDGSTSAGALAFWFRVTSGFTTDRYLFFYCRGSASSSDYIALQLTSVNKPGLAIRNATNGAIRLNLTTSLSADTWYFIVAAWDSAANSRYIGLYDSTGALIEANEDTTTNFTSPTNYLPANLSSRFQFGDGTGAGPYGYVDNVFIGNAYADRTTFLAKRDITSYTEYATAAGQPTGARYNGIPGMNLVSSRFGRGW